MRAVSNRAAGGAIAGIGALLTLGHLFIAIGFDAAVPGRLVAALPTVLSLVMVAVGVEMFRGRLVPDRFAARMLAWTGVGVALLAVFGIWVYSLSLVEGSPITSPAERTVNVVAFGALVGLLIGLYDVRGLKQQESVAQLNRINDTLRIATTELVNRTERDGLEQAICDRLSESDAYEAVWIGRYDTDAERVRPAAWSGLPDEYFQSITITVDDSPTGGGAGGRAIKTGDIQCVPDVFADPTMEPWWDQFEESGVTSLAVVPIDHGSSTYGFFSIYADRPNVFGEREREVLTDLGETIGHAIAALEARERLAEREGELARQNERLEEFAGIVSHDLRNPLNVASGSLELARADGDEAHFARASDALQRMDDLIEDLLTLARQGEVVDEFEPVDLRAVSERAWSTAGSPSATLETGDDLGEISCDRRRLRQLLENLFRNAVEHGSTSPPSHTQENAVEHGSTSPDSQARQDAVEHGGPDATVTVRRTDEGFSVDDDGPGIPPDERRAVFDVGYSTNEDGTGFGLNIVARIAEAHGWDVSVDESPEGGASFAFAGVERVAASDATVPGDNDPA